MSEGPAETTCAKAPSPNADMITQACRQLHEAAARSVPKIFHMDGRIVLCFFSVAGGRPGVAGFAIGDWSGMARQACQWAGREGCNVYFSAALMPRAVVEKGSRGCDADILTVFAVGCDVDRDHGCYLDIATLDCAASLDVLSSPADAGDGFNHNLIWIFEEAIPPDEARRLAGGLACMIGDGTANASSPGHVWRLPGTLNWPNRAKLDRGRSPLPTIAGMQVPPGSGLVPVKCINAMLAARGIDLSSANQKKAGASARPPEQSAKSSSSVTPRAGRWSGDHWRGEALEVFRLLDALRKLPNDCSRSDWRRHLHQIADFFMGRKPGRQIARWWSAGGHLDVITVLDREDLAGAHSRVKSRARRSDVERMMAEGVDKSVYADFDAAEFEREWRDACNNTHGSIGGVYEAAARLGWVTARTPWGLGRALRNPKPLSDEAMAVRAQGVALPEEIAIDRLRIVWLGQVIAHFSGRRADIVAVAYVIARHINKERGFGWASFHRIAVMLGWCSTSIPSGIVRVRDVMRELSRDGFVVASDGRRNGAHGLKGPSYALRFPDASWEEVIAWDTHVMTSRHGDHVAPLVMPPPGQRTTTAVLHDAPHELARTGTVQPHSNQGGDPIETHQPHPSRSKDTDRRKREVEADEEVAAAAFDWTAASASSDATPEAGAADGSEAQAGHDERRDKSRPEYWFAVLGAEFRHAFELTLSLDKPGVCQRLGLPDNKAEYAKSARRLLQLLATISQELGWSDDAIRHHAEAAVEELIATDKGQVKLTRAERKEGFTATGATLAAIGYIKAVESLFRSKVAWGTAERRNFRCRSYQK